jgi:Ca-activated chloride channel homolog
MNELRRALRVLTAVAAAWISTAGPALRAEEPLPVFRSSISVVPITAVVRDRRDRVVRHLRREDFQVREEGQVRPIVDFRSTDRGPVSIGLLVDTSGSMRGTNLDRGRLVVDQLVALLNDPRDEVALFTFDKTIRQETPFTNRAHVIRQALACTTGWGQTSLYDAIADTAKKVGERQSRGRAVVVITDGTDTSSTLTSEEVSARASAIDVPVYVIAVVPPGYAPDGTLAAMDEELWNLAFWTGGDMRYAGAPAQTAIAMAYVMSELRQQYFLAIESATSSGWRRLDVTTRRNNLTVRARSGYFAARY